MDILRKSRSFATNYFTFLKTETENKNLLFSVGLRYQIPNVHIHSFYKRLYLISVFTVSIFKYV